MENAENELKKEEEKVDVGESSVPHASQYFFRHAVKRRTTSVVEVNIPTKIPRNERLVVGYKKMKPNVSTESEKIFTKEIVKKVRVKGRRTIKRKCNNVKREKLLANRKCRKIKPKTEQKAVKKKASTRGRRKRKTLNKNLSKELFGEDLQCYSDNNNNTVQTYPQAQQSLLPSSYPKHFTEQLEKTEVLHLETEQNVKEHPDTPTELLSPTLQTNLQGYFDNNYLSQLLNPISGAYHLTPPHVKFMSIFLKIDHDYLRALLQRIEPLSAEIMMKLVDICEQTHKEVDVIPESPV